jgi:hypothetical protein
MVRKTVSLILFLALFSIAASPLQQGSVSYQVLLPLVVSMDSDTTLARSGEPPGPGRGFAATFLGGSGGEHGLAVSVDQRGDIYIAGRTLSTDFPVTPNAFDRDCGTDGGCNFERSDYSQWHPDLFAAKIDIKTGALVYATYIGGSSYDYLQDMAVDHKGTVYLTGVTFSPDFPTTPGAFQRSMNQDAFGVPFVVKLAADGSSLEYSTFLSSTNGTGLGIDVDQHGSAFVTGSTCDESFPTTPGAFITSFQDTCSGFVTRLNPQGSGLVYSTLLGTGAGQAIKVDNRGTAYITGAAWSQDFPTTPGAFDPTYNAGWSDGFVARLSADGKTLLYSTFLGGSGYDNPISLDIDIHGSVIVTGATDSADFPVTPGAFQPQPEEIFVARLAPGGDELIYATYLGGSDEDVVYRVVTTKQGEAVVAGITKSHDFPVTPDAFDPTCGTDGLCNLDNRYPEFPLRVWDSFITQLDSKGERVRYSTFLGGSSGDYLWGLALANNGLLYFSGFTFSADFPVTAGMFDQTYNGDLDVFAGWLRIK